MITKTMRYEISYNKETFNLLSDIQHAVWRVKNKSMTMAYDWQQFSFGYNERFNVYPKDKDLLRKGLTADIYQQVKELSKFVYSATVDVATHESVNKFKEVKSDVINGRISLPTYRRDGSFPIRVEQIRNIDRINASTYSANLALLSREGAKERGIKSPIPVVLKTGKGAREIIDRVIDGTYKLCDSKISKKKSKFYLLLTYKFEAKRDICLDESKVMGVDVGVVNPAVMAFNTEKSSYFIGGSEITHYRRTVERRRNELLAQGKYCGKGRRGHGRKTRLKPIEKLRGKIANFRDTTNHKYSRYIVDMAIKHGCGTIQLEKLDGINERSTFLKSWPYFDLQTKIEQKAKAVGITVNKIEPAYTSKRCSNCGHIDDANRRSQAKFKCQRCTFEANADYNAAKNIADPDIEEKIAHELKLQTV